MSNNYTKEEITKSIEYKWRRMQGNTFLFLLILMFFVMIICYTIVCLTRGIEFFVTLIYIPFAFMAFFIAIFLPFVIFYYAKARYLLQNYASFDKYEVTLDKPHTTYYYHRSIYYVVTLVKDNKVVKEINTSPLFSGGLFSVADLDKYNNQKVCGLYDKTKDKFYVIG